MYILSLVLRHFGILRLNRHQTVHLSHSMPPVNQKLLALCISTGTFVGYGLCLCGKTAVLRIVSLGHVKNVLVVMNRNHHPYIVISLR